jgi:hypothetical protein
MLVLLIFWIVIQLGVTFLVDFCPYDGLLCSRNFVCQIDFSGGSSDKCYRFIRKRNVPVVEFWREGSFDVVV